MTKCLRPIVMCHVCGGSRTVNVLAGLRLYGLDSVHNPPGRIVGDRQN